MNRDPPWFDDGPPTDVLETIRDRRDTASAHREAFEEAMEAQEYSAAIEAKRAYQLAVFKRRQAEGELLWTALGHAIADVAASFDPDAAAVERRGAAFVRWAIDADVLASIDSRDRLLLVVARRSPTLPAAHAPYAESMFGVSREDIATKRERDQSRLSAAGWKRETGRGGAVGLVTCPNCDGRFPVRRSTGASATISATFDGGDDAMHEFCPHCESDVYVRISPPDRERNGK
ncbi:hypothetical protein HSRCO_2840 [Halanaeroarchaeum sp. HSR-CO]|uniref:hypothetical protein n=1 Tax=Halanaeroarchaeum sp. HSR-CO TaxID=2866382 RepID=UPI00217EB5F4|nr:hypothetical protein [Halanaeroarchaeum sp. HSR-CO]UWG49096.1 hypothetical protein HSRCO_2840 [Halanaeroarchaeum sp. HSR-CO]